MQKFLRTLTLLALMVVPWVAQGQNANVSEYDMSYSTATYTSVTTSGGNALTFTNGTADVNMPFAMYFGTTQIPSGSTLTVKQDGSVSFAALDGSYIAPMRYYSSSSASTSTNYTGGTVYAKSTASQLTIEWRKVTTNRNIYSFQLCLFPSGNIEFRYGPMTLDGSINVLVGMKATGTDYFRLRGEGGTSYWNSMERVVNDASKRTLSSVYHPDYDLATSTGAVYTFSMPACVKPVMSSVTAPAWDTINVSWTAGTSANRTGFQVAYSTSNIDFNTAAASEYTVVNATIAANATSLKVKVPAANTTYHAAVRAICGTNNYSAWSASDYATTPSGCPNLSGFNTTGVTATAATLNWTASIPATSYDVRYNLGADFDPTANQGTLATTTTASKSLTGLTGSSTYYYYVRAHCVSGIETDWYGPYTFNTACGAQNVPYTQNFEDYDLPMCWNEEVISGTDNWTFSGNNQATFIYTPDASSRLTTPFFNLSATGAYQVEFYHAEPDYSGVCDSLWLYYRTSATAQWVRLAQYGNHSSNFIHETVLLPNPTATYQLAFVSYGMDGNSIYLANVVVRPQPTCPAPTGLAATNAGVVSWTASTNNTSYDIVYGPAGFTTLEEATLIENVTGTSYTLTNIEGSTSYDVYIRAHCSATSEISEGWVGPESFTTPCMLMDIPYTMEFENSNCWTLISNNTANASTNTSSSTYFGTLTYDNKSVLVFNSWSNASDYFQYAYSPQLNTANVTGNNLRLTIRYSTRANTDPVRFGYTTVANSTNPSDYTWTSDFLTSGYTDWQTYEALIPKTATNVAINYASTGCNYKAYIDYVIVDVPPTCIKPTDLAATPNATASSVTASLSWTENSSTPATQWEVRYWKAGTTDTNSVIATTNNGYVLNYLEMGATYNWQVRALCSATDQSEWSAVSNFSIAECLTGPVSIGNGTSTTTGVPVANYGSTYCQQIFTAAELTAAGLTAGEINSLSFNWSAVETSYDKYFSIYMANTTQSSFASTSDFVPFSDLTMVYGPQYREHGTISTGVEVFNFTTNFVWDGTSNIVVATLMNAGASDGNASTRAKTHNTGVSNISMFQRKDGSQYTDEQLATITGNTRSTYRANIVFNPTAPCNQGECVPPTVAITTGPDGDNAKADLTFSDGEGAYGYIYGPAGFTPNMANGVAVTGNTATITPLAQETTFDLYVYSVCTGVTTPRMVRYSFTTPFVPTCKPQVNFATSNVTFTGATVTWQQEDPNQVPESWTVRYATTNFDPTTAAASEYTEVTVAGAAVASLPITGLHNGDHIYMYTKATCNAAQNDLSVNWSSYDFAIPTIEAPASVTNWATTNSTDSLSWTEATEGINSWTVRYNAGADFDPEGTEGMTLAATSNKVKLTGLDAYTNYFVYVRANSGNEHSAWSAKSTFKTKCPDGGELALGDMTTNNSYLPLYTLYDYSFTEQIYTAEDLGAATQISSISYYVNSANANDRDPVQVYMANTDKAAFESTTDWVSTSNMTLVYDGPMVTSQTGWHTLEFTTPFAYDGTNLIIAVNNNDGVYQGTANFGVINANGNQALRAYRDNTAYDPTNPGVAGALLTVKNNFIFGANCNTNVTCFAPVIDSVKIDSSNHVTLYYKARTDLEPAVNVFDINYGIKGFNPDQATQYLVSGRTANTYTFTAPLAATEFDVYVRTHCGDNDHSNWTKASFESYPAVFAPTNLTSTANTETSVTLTWVEKNPVAASQWELVAMEPGFIPNESGDNAVKMVPTTTKTATVTDLQHMKFYDFYVRAVKGANKSEWSAVCTASTGCGTLQYADMPYVENFDNYTGNTSGTEANHKMPNCWNYLNMGTNTTYKGLPSIYSTASYSHSTPNSLRFYIPTANTNGDQIAILPELGFSPDTLEMSLFARFYSASNYFVVGMLSTTVDTSDFEPIDTVKAPSTGYNTQAEYSVSFKNYTGSKRYIAIKAPKLSVANYIYLDDVTLKLREKVNPVGTATATLTICNEFVQPVSDANGNYPVNLNTTYVIRPAEAGKVVNLSGEYDLESGYDFVYVYEGEGANKVIVDTLTGNGTINIHTASNDWVNRGSYTLVFRTDADNSLPMIGFKFLAECVCPEVAPEVVATRHEANGTYTWNGITRNNQMSMEAAPDLEDILTTTLTNVAGCDSVALADTLILHPTYNLPFSRTICQRDTAYFFDTAFTTQGVYTVNLQTVYGGDSTGVLSLTVNNAPTAGIYFDGNEESSVAGFCDNADMLLEARSSVNNATFLWEDSSTAALRTVNPHLSNSYSVIAINPATGCTSVPATITVTTTPVAVPSITATDSTICRGQSTTLTVLDASEMTGVTYKWSNNQTGTSITVTPDSTSTYTVTATTSTGCATTATFTVTVIQLPEVILSTSLSEVCRDSAVILTATSNAADYSYAWSNGATTAVTTVNPNVTGDYTVTVTDAYGCSQEFTTAAITVHPSYEMNVEASECVNSLPYTFGTQSLTVDGLYTEHFTIAHNCDSLVHLTFTVQDTAVNNTARELCYGTEFTFGEGIYQQAYTATTSGVITYLDTTSGCPAYYNLNLTVNMPAASSFSADVCDTYAWKNGQTVVGTFTETGTYVDTMATVKGCDSVVTLNLTVRYSNTGIDNQDVCDQLEWIDGNVYTEPNNVAQFTLTNAANCDSVVTLNLTAVRHATTGIDDITYCDDTVYTWINGRTYKLSETRGNIRYTLTDQTNAQGCDSTVVLNLVMNPVRDTVLWRDTTVCDELVMRIVTCEGAVEDYSISDSGDYQLRVHNAELDRDEILQLHVHMGKSTTHTTIAEGCLPYIWDVDGNGLTYTVKAEDYVGAANPIIISQEVASVDGCSVFGVLRLTAHHPVIENVEHVMCYNDSWDTLSHNFVASDLVENENYTYDITLSSTPEGCDSTLHLMFSVLDSSVVTVEDTLFEGQFVMNEETGDYEYAWVSQTNVEDTLILTIPYRYSQMPLDGSNTAIWQKENGCDSTITVNYHVIPTLFSFEPDTIVCSEFTWERDGRVVTTVTKDDAEFIVGNLNGAKFSIQIYDTLKSETFGYDSIIVKNVLFWGNDTVENYFDTTVCTQYEWQGVTYRTDSTFYVLAGQTVNGCDSINAYNFHVVGDMMHDWNVVTNEPYRWNINRGGVTLIDSTYKTSVNEFVDVTVDGCDQVIHLNLTILDNPINYCADDTNIAVIEFTNDSLVPSVLYEGYKDVMNPVRLANRLHHSGDINVAPYTYNDTLIFFYIRPVYNQHFDTVVCASSFTWNDAVYTDTGNYTQHLLSMYGCDSTVTYNAWISGVDYTANVKDSVVAACDAYTFEYYQEYTPADNDSMSAFGPMVSTFTKTFKQSIDTTLTFKTAAGCDTIVHLSLTVNKNTPVVVKDTACEDYVWTVTNNAATEIAGNIEDYTEGDYEFDFIATDVNGCVTTDSLYLHVKENTYVLWDTIVNEPSFVYRGQFFQAPYDDFFTFMLGTATNGCDSILVAHIIVTTGEVVTVTKNECGRYTWPVAEHGNGHTYQWISDAESAAHGNALYKDITDNVYIHTAENPMEKEYIVNANGDSILVHTYVLHLNLYEALFADTTIARYPVTMGSTLSFFGGNDSLNAVNLVIPADTMPTAAKPATVHIDTALALTYKSTYNNYYGCAFYDVHLNVVYNFDTAAAIVNCFEEDSVVLNGTRYDLAVADSTPIDVVFNAGTFNEQHTRYYVTRKAAKTGTVDDAVVCNAFTWTIGNNDSIYTVSTTNLTTTLIAADGCDSVVTMANLVVNSPAVDVYTVKDCDSAYFAIKDVMYYVSTIDTINRMVEVSGLSCLAVDTVKVTVVPTVHRLVLDTTVCDSYTWHSVVFDVTGEYAYDYVNTVSGISCNNSDTLKLVVNYSAATTPEDTVFGENYREAGQLYSAPYEGTVVRNLQTVKGCDSVATVHLVVAFYTDTNIVRNECGVYTWSAADYGNGHYYRSITDEEAIANNNAIYYDETDGVYITSNPAYAPAKGETNYGYRYHLQLSLQGAVFSEKDTTYLLSKGATMTYAGNDFDYSSLITRQLSKDTIQTVRFGAVAGACDSIQNVTVHVVYNYTHEKDTVCAEHNNTYAWRGKNWTLGAAGTTVTFVDTAAKNTPNMWIYTNDVTRNAAIVATDVPVDKCDKFVWGNKTFTKDTNNVSVVFTAANGCDSTVTRASITIRYSSQFDSTKVICDQFKWTERSDSLYTASTVDTVKKVNAVGCDSLAILHLTINRNPGSYTEVTACDQYYWAEQDKLLTEGGMDTLLSIDANGCRNYDTLALVINKSTVVYDTLYNGEGAVRYNGHLYVAGQGYSYADTAWLDLAHIAYDSNGVGCYNIDSVYVQIGNFYHRDIQVVACQTYTWPLNNHTYTFIPEAERTAGAMYYDTTASDTVFINPIVTSPNEGDYDSVIMLMLTLTQNVTGEDEVTLPVSLAEVTYGDSTFYYTEQRDQALNGGAFDGYEDIRYVHFFSVQYCDSVIALNVHVVNNYVPVDTVDICATQTSYTWRGHTISTETTDFDNIHNYYVYDTVGTAEAPVVEYRRVIQHPVVYTVERRYACDVYEWNGETFTESTTNYTKVFEGGSEHGNMCDSTVILHLTLYNTTSSLTEDTVCDTYTWNAARDTANHNYGITRTYTQSIDTIVAYNNVYPYKTCQSYDTLHLVVNHKQTATETAVACDSYDMYTFDGTDYVVDTTFTTDTTGYVRVLTDMNGCDSTVTLTLTVNHSTQRADTIKVTAFQEYVATSGKIYTETGEYKDTITNVAGCDSIEVINLTISNGVKTDYAFICDSVIWHNAKYTEAGTYFYNFENSIVKDTLVIGEVRHASHDVYTEMACNEYTWTFPTYYEIYAGTDSAAWVLDDSVSYTYTTSGVKKNLYFNAFGCPSVDTLNLTINKRTFAEDVVTACGSFDWVVNDSLIGTFTQSIETQTAFYNPRTACDSVTFLKLTVKYAPITDTADVICQSALPYTWRGIEMTEGGVADVTYPMENGCDSTVRFTLTVNPVYVTELTASICLGNGYNENGFDIAASELAEAGVYYDTLHLTSIAGCDSTVTLALTVSDVLINTEVVAACDSYTWNGVTYTKSGEYFRNYTNNQGCVSVDTLKLTINVNHGVVENQVVCNDFSWNGMTFNTDTTVIVHFADANGCFGDSILNLTIADTEQVVYIETACESFTWSDVNDSTYTESGLYTYEYTNESGCPGNAILYLTINEPINSELTTSACDSYTWFDEDYTTTGTYTHAITDANGCDATATLNLTIFDSYVVDTAATACGSFEWYDSVYTASTVTSVAFTTVNGCDSIVTLALTINQPVNTVLTETACGSYTWGDAIYVTSGTYEQTFQAENGCDSVVTLNLTINEPINTVATTSNCDSYVWFDEIYTTTGTYTHAITDANGCAATATLNLTIYNSVNNTISAENCVSYTWNNQTYYGSGSYTQNFQTVYGCDSVVTLNLTINQPTTGSETIESCTAITWNGQSISTTGAYTYTTVNANGCDSVVTLFFTRLQPVATTVNETACGSYTWNGTTYTTSGSYNHTYTAANGCDSIVTLVLTVNEPINTGITASNCDSYTWFDVDYTTSGTYTHAITDVNGCAAIATLNLTIYNSVTTTVNAENCSSYEWNGQTYYGSGSYTQNFQTAHGCDSIVTLALTIIAPTEVTITENACTSYEWNGETYTTSGTYTYTTTGANGCDSITTLVLTVNQPVYTNLVVTADGSYTWNGTVYTESGIYTYTTESASGCDSIVTLDLTVNPIYTVTLVSANETMGTVSESGSIVENGYFTAIATANEGYEFVEWRNGSTVVSTNATYVFQVTGDITLTAVFQQKQVGIEDVDMDNVTIYSSDSRIFVRGAEGYDVYVYDVNGRMMDRQLNAADAIEFRMTATGVYLVKVGNAPAKRVVVVR